MVQNSTRVDSVAHPLCNFDSQERKIARNFAMIFAIVTDYFRQKILPFQNSWQKKKNSQTGGEKKNSITRDRNSISPPWTVSSIRFKPASVYIDSSMEYLEFDFFFIWHLITLCPKNLFKKFNPDSSAGSSKVPPVKVGQSFFLAFVDLFLCVRQILFLSLFLIARISTRDQRTSL
jgi:hypothetical protein